MITTFITTYRRPDLLKRGIESVLAQTYPHFQLCVYDDASDDETESIVKAFAKSDSRVKYHLHPKNIGMMANYAYAFAEINTPYFSFFSDDDYLLPDFFEIALNGFKIHPDAAFSACGVQAITNDGEPVVSPLDKWSRDGYFLASEGALEMVRAVGSFPFPTGILFQTKFAKEVVPDLSEEITLMWDPNYFMQIAARYPIVINRKQCAFFLVHGEAYSSGFYAQLEKSADGFDSYFKATKRVSDQLSVIPSISNENRIKLKVAFEEMFQYEIFLRMRYYLLNFNANEAIRATVFFKRYFSPNYRMTMISFVAEVCGRIPFLGNILGFLLQNIKKSIFFLRKIRGAIKG